MPRTWHPLGVSRAGRRRLPTRCAKGDRARTLNRSEGGYFSETFEEASLAPVGADGTGPRISSCVHGVVHTEAWNAEAMGVPALDEPVTGLTRVGRNRGAVYSSRRHCSRYEAVEML